MDSLSICLATISIELDLFLEIFYRKSIKNKLFVISPQQSIYIPLIFSGRLDL